MKKYEISTLTRDDVIELYGEIAKGPTFWGVAARIDGRLVAAGGFQIKSGAAIAFCHITPEFEQYKTAIHRQTLKMLDRAKTRHKKIIAIQDFDIAGSGRWLERLGFKEIDKGVWQCN